MALRSCLRRARSQGERKRASFSDEVVEWVVEDLGSRCSKGEEGTSCDREDEDNGIDSVVLDRWRSKLKRTKTASSKIMTVLKRLGPHLRCEKRFEKAAAVFTKLIKSEPVSSLPDAYAVRDALAIALRNGRAEFVHQPASRRKAFVALFDAALDMAHRISHGVVSKDVALWACAATCFNMLLDSSPAPSDLKVDQGNAKALASKLLNCLEVVSRHDDRNSTSSVGDRRLDVPSHLDPCTAIFAARAFDCLMALAACYKLGWAPRALIVQCFDCAKRCAFIFDTNKSQRRRIEVMAATVRATRAVHSSKPETLCTGLAGRAGSNYI